jgi:mRNA interferase RelE/StbE
MKTITYTASADKSLTKLSIENRDRVEAGIETYALTGHGDVKAMKGSPTLRLRVGDYRVIFTEALEVLDVIAVGNRSNIYL